MSQFIETVCFEFGEFQRIELHNERCNRTRHHFFGNQPEIRLEQVLSIPAQLKTQKVKCTVTYGIDILNIEYSVYVLRTVNSLQLITHNTIDYDFKYADRSQLTELFQQRGQCDDILIIKKGLITDTYYANAIYLFNNKWYSQQNPLFFGTRLQHYLKENIVIPALLTPNDLSRFSEARIINAMISIENSTVIPISSILF